MKPLKLRHLALLPLPFLLSGCQLLSAGGAIIGPLFSLAMYVAAIAIPALLSYYIYTGRNPFRPD